MKIKETANEQDKYIRTDHMGNCKGLRIRICDYDRVVEVLGPLLSL